MYRNAVKAHEFAQGAVVVSALLVGAIVGSLGAGPAADALGPRRALLLNNLFFAAGSLLGAATPGGYWGAIAGACPGRSGARSFCHSSGRGTAEHGDAKRLLYKACSGSCIPALS